MSCTKHNLKAFSTIEIILAIALFMLMVLGLVATMAFGVQQQKSVAEETKATYLLEEGLEALVNIRDAAFSNLVDGTHGIVLSSNAWGLSGTSDATDGYTRTIVVSAVDAYTKQAVVTVSWIGSNGARSISSTEQLTNIARTITTGASWETPAAESTLDLSASSPVNVMASSGSTVYVANSVSYNTNIFAVDVSNPADPVQTASNTAAGIVYGLAVSGNYLYVSTDYNAGEIQVFNLTTNTRVAMLNITGNGDGRHITISGNYLYFTRLSQNGVTQFFIINISNPNSPSVTGSLALSNKVNLSDITISGNYAIIGTDSDNAEIVVLNVSNPANPVYTVGVNVSGTSNVEAIWLKGTYLFVSKAGDPTVYIYNVANPASPALITSFNAGGTVYDFADGGSSSNYLFLATNKSADEFQVWNVGTINSPFYVNSVSAGGVSLYDVEYLSGIDRVVAGTSSSSKELIVFKPAE